MSTWKEEDSLGTAKARKVAKSYEDPDLRNGDVEIAGCLSRRLPHLRLVSHVAGFEFGYQERLSPGGWLRP